MYVRMYVLTYVGTCVRRYVRTYVRTYVCMYVRTYVRTYGILQIYTSSLAHEKTCFLFINNNITNMQVKFGMLENVFSHSPHLICMFAAFLFLRKQKHVISCAKLDLHVGSIHRSRNGIHIINMDLKTNRKQIA